MFQELYLICHSGETRNSQLLVNWFLGRSLVQMWYPAHIHLPRVSMACPVTINHRKRVEDSEQTFIHRAAGNIPQWLTAGPYHTVHFMVTLPCHRWNIHSHQKIRRKVPQVSTPWLRVVVVFASPGSRLGSPLLDWMFNLQKPSTSFMVHLCGHRKRQKRLQLRGSVLHMWKDFLPSDSCQVF